MNAIRAIAQREASAFFSTPVGWICLCSFIVVTGFFFAVELTNFSVQSSQSMGYGGDLNINEAFLPYFFGNWAVILLFICPALSMGVFADDMRQRSFELLMAAPVSSFEIVLGKYLGMLGFLAVMFACTLHYVGILYWLSSPDPGVLLSSYAVMFLLAACFMAVGMFVSAHTQSQVVAFVLSFGLLLLLWVLSWTETFTESTLGAVLSTASMLTHLEQLIKGLMHVKDLVYFVSFIAFFVFATQQRIEATRWL